MHQIRRHTHRNLRKKLLETRICWAWARLGEWVSGWVKSQAVVHLLRVGWCIVYTELGDPGRHEAIDALHRN